MIAFSNNIISTFKIFFANIFICLFLLAISSMPAIAKDRCSLRIGPLIKVMTRNLYVGADLFEIFSVDTSNPMNVPIAVSNVMNTVHDTNFPERAKALADEIDKLRPDLIGLQEVSLIRTQSPGDFIYGNPSLAKDILYDYLEILLNALADRGLNYEVAAMVNNADMELPVLVSFPGETALFDDVRLTDRDVILKRSNIITSNITAKNYTDNLLDFTRGFVAVDAKIGKRSYRVINTHLEVQGEGYEMIQSLQAKELMAELEYETLPVILIGDFNSSPQDAATQQPYSIIRENGFIDIWKRSFWHSSPGYTCCQEADLLNKMSVLYERIDLIFVRNNCGHLPFSPLGPVFAVVTGNNKRGKSESGLWPSDHAGLNAWLWIPKLRCKKPSFCCENP